MPAKRTRKDESGEESSTEEAPVLKKKPASGTVTVPIPDKHTDVEGNTYFEISGKRRVTVRSFNGLKLVDVREMYTDKASGELKPGKKGISLSEEQASPSSTLSSPGLTNLSLWAFSRAIKTTRTVKTTTKASSSKEPKESKPTSKSKPASKKKARKAESEEEEEEEKEEED